MGLNMISCIFICLIWLLSYGHFDNSISLLLKEFIGFSYPLQRKRWVMSGVVSIFKPAFIYICICFHYLKNGSSVANNSDFCTTHDFVVILFVITHRPFLRPPSRESMPLDCRSAISFLSFSVLQVLFPKSFGKSFGKLKCNHSAPMIV